MKVIDVTSQFKMNYLSSSVGLEVALIFILDFFKFLIKQKINLHVYKEKSKNRTRISVLLFSSDQGRYPIISTARRPRAVISMEWLWLGRNSDTKARQYHQISPRAGKGVKKSSILIGNGSFQEIILLYIYSVLQ